MKFCDKCGLKLKSGLECPNCKNTYLLPNKTSNNIRETSFIKNFEPESIVKGEIMKQEQNQSLEEINTKRVRLVVSKGGTENREFPLNKEVCYIGRWDPALNSYPDVDLSDEDIDAKVSRVHAKIIKKPEGLYIEDMGSRNGTFLNREFRLVKGIEYALKPEDELIIGHIFFKVKSDDTN